MELKFGLLFWLAGIVLIGSLQMLMVEGLTCDICNEVTQNFNKSVVCGPPMPCNSAADVRQAVKEFQRHTNELVQGKPQAQPDAEGGVAQLIRRQNDEDGTNEGSTPDKFICVKSVGQNSKSDRLESSCLNATGLPAPRNEPYNGSDTTFFKEATNGFGGFVVHICDDTNEDVCRVSKIEISRVNARYPAHDGLMCSICKRIGSMKSKDIGPCKPMPCNSMEEKSEADKYLKGEGGSKRKRRDGKTETEVKTTSFSCVKVLGTAKAAFRTFDYTYGYCSAAMPNYPAKPDPYPNELPADIEAFEEDIALLQGLQGTFELKTFYVCDQTNELKCHISEEERKPERSTSAGDGKNPGQGGINTIQITADPFPDDDDSTSGTAGGSTTAAAGGTKKTTTTGPGGAGGSATGGAFGLAPTATVWLLFVSKLIKYFL